jgi:hypothetical protein
MVAGGMTGFGLPGSSGSPVPGGADVDGPVAQAIVNISGETSARTRSMMDLPRGTQASARVVYVSSQCFMNEYVNEYVHAIRAGDPAVE